MSGLALLAQADRIRSRIVRRYYEFEQGVHDGSIDPVHAILEHLRLQGLLPKLDLIEQEAMRL